MKVISSIVYFILFSCVAYSSSGHETHGAEAGVPKVVFYQAINVAIILIAGVYLGRQKIAHFFNQKKNMFLEAQQKAQAALKIAETEHHEVKTRLEKLKGNKTDSITKAKTDATDLKAQMLLDAQAQAKKLREEALLTAKIEGERAKSQLKEQLIREAFELSKKDLSSKATSDDQKKLQQDFISKVQVVQ